MGERHGSPPRVANTARIKNYWGKTKLRPSRMKGEKETADSWGRAAFGEEVVNQKVSKTLTKTKGKKKEITPSI